MTIDTVHEELIRANLDAPMTEEDALLWMVLLHTHEIRLRSPLLGDRPKVMSLAAITQRHCSEVMAALWRGQKRSERASSTYWYHRYLQKGYEAIEDMPPDKVSRLQEIRGRLSTDPRIDKIVPED